jgi:integrase
MVLQMPRPFRKPETGVYYFRRIVPEDIRAITGKTEVRRSLKTKDPRTAARRFTEAAREVEKEWEELRREPESTALAGLDPQALSEDAMGMEGILDERDAHEDWEPTPKALRAAIRSRTGVSVALGAAEAVYRRKAVPDSPEGSQSFSLQDMLAGWWTEAKAAGRKPSTYESYRNTVAGLTKFLDHDDASQVSPEDVVSFKDHRLAKGVSAKTVKDSDLAALKTVFGWAVSNRKLPSNPTTGITIKLGKPQKLRGKGLTEEEARAILQAAMKVGGSTLPLTKTDAARRWVPWLAAYTGARVGELAQLRKQDVTKEGDHWVLLLTPEAGTIKTNEARKVVLHPHLVELGFPAFGEAAQPGHLFLKPAKSGDVLGPLQGLKNRLAEFSRSIVSDPNVAPMHGFRHRFKTVGMDCGISTRVLDAIQGHAARTAGDGYGDVTVKAMAMAMEKVPRVVVESSS